MLNVTIFLTGIVAECQQERSQIRNKEKAMQMLCAKLYNAKLEEETKKRNYARKIQVSFIYCDLILYKRMSLG